MAVGGRWRSRRRLLALVVTTIAWGAPAEDFRAKVVAVGDGDTITVLRVTDTTRTEVKVRLFGVDAPEFGGQAFGGKAKSFTSERAFGVEVQIKVKEKDRYGRTVAEVVLPDGTLLNHEIVRAGLAWWYRRFAPGDQELAALEAEARKERRGLWADPHPVAPWEWRTTERAGAAAAR